VAASWPPAPSTANSHRGLRVNSSTSSMPRAPTRRVDNNFTVRRHPVPGDVVTVMAGPGSQMKSSTTRISASTDEDPIVPGDTVVVHGPPGRASTRARRREVHPANAALASWRGRLLRRASSTPEWPAVLRRTRARGRRQRDDWTSALHGARQPDALAQGAAAVRADRSTGGVDPAAGEIHRQLVGYEVRVGARQPAGDCGRRTRPTRTIEAPA